MDKYDTTQLTEFPRFEAESSQSGVSSFLNILWKLPLFSPSEGETSQSKAITDGKEKVSQGESSSVKEEEEKPETGSYAVELEGRSLPNVLRRISSLVALGSGGGTRYADTELARYWMPDDISRECYECATRFSTLRRRHHCRVCGQIFCSRCCSQRVPGHIFGCPGGLRVCTYCCNVVLSYLKENDMTGDISPDLKTLQENLQSKFPENKSTAANKGCDNFMLSRDQGERCEARATPKEALEDVYRQLSFTLPTQQHRYRLVRYNGVWRGCDILQWVMDNTDNKTRVQASQVCQSLLSQGYMECVSEILHFADYALYKPTVTPPQAVSEEIPPEAESAPRLVESVSSYCLDLNLGDNSARLTKAMRTEKKLETPPSGDENPVFEQNEAPSSPVCPAVAASGEDHLDLLMRQCLARRALPAAWRRLLPLCARAAAGVTPHMLSSDLDVRNYVQVKKVPGGDPSECCLIPGVVLTKNVTHRGMPQQITNPTVLLLDCSIAFQRVEGKLTTLEPILLQEQEYLMRCAARITALQPHVLLVRGSAARALQDALRAARLALAVGVRQRSLYRLARCLRADVVTSIDARIGTPRLGTAKNFYIKNYSSKTLMVLENCAEPNLGCCILLRGGSLAELTRLKKVIKFMVLACYNWRLEKALLGDLEATLPEAGTVFDDDENFEENIDKPSKDEENGSGDNVEEGKIDSDTKPKDEPPQSVKFIRKAEDKTLSVPVPDCSDPLRTTDDDVFLARDDVTLTAGDERTDRWCIDDAVLSMSPNVSLEPPAEPSRLLAPPPAPPAPPRAAPPPTRPQELHPFASTPLRAFADDPSVRSSLALFRAMGPPLVRDGRHMPTCPLYTAPPAAPSRPDTPDTPAPEPDPLAPENHQRLPLLLYSYSARSPNAPDFCVNPWTVTMEMYGRHDISLGGFLKKYCFDPEYKCPSGACTVPMNQHVRKFVHGDVCITITCNTIGHSNVDKEKEDQNKQITVWTRCGVCGSQSGPRVLSARARSVSLAVFLLVRARAARYVRRRCRHALRHAAIGIVCGLTAASVRFDKISTFEVSLPPEVIWTKYDTKQMRDALFNQLNELMLKAHETFSGESDSDAQSEYQSFKSHTESVQIALTSTRLQARGDPAAVVRSLWSISDRIIFAEKMLREAQDKWSSPLVKSNKVVTDNQVEEKPDIEEPINDSGITDSLDAASRDLDKEHAGVEEDEEKGDKKTVRQILTQLLSNNQTINQEGIILSSGVIPVVVLGGEIGSVIAASLASVTYQRAVRTKHTSQSELEEEATSSVGKDKSDTDKAKTKSNEHIEVLLKDGLVCRVYFAAQFQRLRHFVLRPLAVNPHVIDVFANKHEGRGERGERSEGAGGACGCDDGKERGDKNLCEIEEAFIRSLAHCVPWAARGGKSGSTFCKTKDDRYVLKEMTKAEWQVFLEFAPHYFNYITSCMQSKQPSLLARILGVYSVGGAGNGVLVMENVWYACAGARYDLKGSTRHRAAPPAAAVLLDHNLLSLRWDTQFYVSAEAGRELNALAARDTAFLTQHDVMDYSLLLAVDGRTLVVALIDYIRTFTWDKKLEHLVKKNLGSGSPTVVSPTQYRLRFLAALRKYFLPTPTHWDPVWCEEDKNKETN